MIMLAGIVVNNAIVLVDYINTLRARGMPRDEAIVTAGSVRLRPILMTTATTVLGLLPMALGLGDGAEIRTPMAIAVISGLITSTVLTLVVIPAIYALVDRFQARLAGRRAEAEGSAPGRRRPMKGRKRPRRPATAAWCPTRERPANASPSPGPIPVPARRRAARGTRRAGSRWEGLLPRFSLHRRITVLVLLASTLVVGVVASLGIPLELFPSGFTSQNLRVFVPWTDAPPEEVAEKILVPLEDELSHGQGASTSSTPSPAPASARSPWASSRAPTWTSPTARCATASSAPAPGCPPTPTASTSARTTPPASRWPSSASPSTRRWPTPTT